MMAADKDALICDLAETYHVLDYRALPVKTLAALACGLGPESRSKRRLSGAEVDVNTLLLAIIADRLGLLFWAKTEDGVNGWNRPQSIAAKLLGQTPEGPVESYASGEDFNAAWKSRAEGE